MNIKNLFSTSAKITLRLEGLALFFGALLLYWLFQGETGVFIILFLTPDVSLIGYAWGNKLGALTYNFVHNYATALLLILAGVFTAQPFITGYGIILMAHISIDRVLGFGIKYSNDFKTTHLQKV